jgi:hypothetical protein
MSSSLLEFSTTIIIIIVKFTKSRKLQRVLKYVTCVLYRAHLCLKLVYRPKHVALLSIVEYKKSCLMVSTNYNFYKYNGINSIKIKLVLRL